MTQHNREVEEQIKTLVDRYTPVGSARVHLRIKFLDMIEQAEDRGAAKLAEELLGSEELQEREVFVPDESNYDDVARQSADRSENYKINQIKAKIKELCPTTTPSST